MVLPDETNKEASAPAQDVVALASTYFLESATPEISPSLSLYSTPALSFAQTPETPLSTFDGYSPALSSGDMGTSLDCFGSDYPIFAGDSMSGSIQSTFDNAIQDPQFAPIDFYTGNLYDSSLPTSPKTLNKEMFVNLSDVETAASPTIPVEHAVFDYASKPAIIRSSSDSSVFAVPKLPRGRKRKSSVDVNAASKKAPAFETSTSSSSAFEDEEDEKVKLRAKNTESAARSRLRKKLELSQAVLRSQELEEEVRLLKIESAKKDALLQRLEQRVSNLVCEVEQKSQLLAMFEQ